MKASYFERRAIEGMHVWVGTPPSPRTHDRGILRYFFRPLPWARRRQCLDEIQQQYDALMAEGILPASPPMITPSKLAKLHGQAGARGASIPGVVVGEGGAGGEVDPDLELDDDGGGDDGREGER